MISLLMSVCGFFIYLVTQIINLGVVPDLTFPHPSQRINHSINQSVNQLLRYDLSLSSCSGESALGHKCKHSSPQDRYISLTDHLSPNNELKNDHRIFDKHLLSSDGSLLTASPAIISAASYVQFLALRLTSCISLSQMYDTWNSPYSNPYSEFIF